MVALCSSKIYNEIHHVEKELNRHSEVVSKRISKLAFDTKVHSVSKNVPPSTCYNFDIHDLIKIIFGRSVTKKIRNQMMLCFPISPI